MNDPVSKSMELAKRALAKSSSKEIILPEWPTSKRSTPNAFLRSALFSAIQSKDRVFLDGVVLASQEGINQVHRRTAKSGRFGFVGDIG